MKSDKMRKKKLGKFILTCLQTILLPKLNPHKRERMVIIYIKHLNS